MRTDCIRLLIVGAGKAGQLITENILSAKDSSFKIVGYVDDNTKIVGKKLGGLTVFGTINDIANVITDNDVEEVLIALPSERGEIVRRIINLCAGTKVSFKILPRESEVLLQEFKEDYVRHIRRIEPEDLFGGKIEKEDHITTSRLFRNEKVLITGAAGSIGSELSRQVAVYEAKKIVLFDWWENGMFELRNQLLEINPNCDYQFVIGDMKDRKRLDEVMVKFKPTTVFHAGAYKHVPLMEGNSVEAVKNNIIGTETVAELAIKNNVKKFILVSTDKAVNPTNIMGATKRTAEMLISVLAESQNTTTFCAVRFGNVINSNGSAIPYFQKQIDRGGPVSLTHKDVTRFFMSIPEACSLIIKAWSFGDNNDVFVLDMGESIKIYDLVKTLIILNGYIPETELKIEIIGLRPGEKLYEEVLVGEEKTKATRIDKIHRTQNYMNFNKLEFVHKLGVLKDKVQDGTADYDTIKNMLVDLVGTYKPVNNG